MTFIKHALCTILLAGSLLAQADNVQKTEPNTVSQVDVVRYMGTWHEIARLPMSHQDDCARDVQAVYTLNKDKTVAISNSCRRIDGGLMKAEGLAQLADDTGSKLRVTFLPTGLRWLPFGQAQYWILRLDDDYQTALVGTPNRKYLWLLSRTPQIDPEVYESYLQTAREQGYDLRFWLINP